MLGQIALISLCIKLFESFDSENKVSFSIWMGSFIICLSFIGGLLSNWLDTFISHIVSTSLVFIASFLMLFINMNTYFNLFPLTLFGLGFTLSISTHFKQIFSRTLSSICLLIFVYVSLFINGLLVGNSLKDLKSLFSPNLQVLILGLIYCTLGVF